MKHNLIEKVQLINTAMLNKQLTEVNTIQAKL